MTSILKTNDAEMFQQRRTTLGWDAVDACQQIRELLHDYFGPDGVGYSSELDQRYRALRSKLFPPLSMLPGISEESFPVQSLPPSLGFLPQLRLEWWTEFGRPSLDRFQGQLVMAMDFGECPRPNKSGRPKGRTDRSREWYFEKAGECLRQHGEVPTRDKFIEFCSSLSERPLSLRTMRGNLKAWGLWPWEKFREAAFSSSKD